MNFIHRYLALAAIPVVALIESSTAIYAATLDDVKHVIVIMQENRSFDHYFADLGLPEFYGDEVDVYDRQPVPTGLISRKFLIPFHLAGTKRGDPAHGWRSMWSYYNAGQQNRFSKGAMGYYTKDDLPYYHALANQYAISDRYFSSVMGPTHPNRSFLLAGTSYGFCTNFSWRSIAATGIQPYLIMDALEAGGRTWGYYTDGKAFLQKLFGTRYPKGNLAQFEEALESDTLPDVVFLDAVLGKTDEHPKADPALGEDWVQTRIESIQDSACWDKCVIFLTYDEGGGFYDHASVPAALEPDDYLPRGKDRLKAYLTKNWGFNRYGFRVPFLAISPFAKQHYVSHEVADHTSVLRFIEKRFNIPPLGRRDAVAHDLMDMFEFEPGIAINP